MIVLFGLFLRIMGIGQASLWNDELCTFERVTGDLVHTCSTLKGSPFPPLYYFIVNAWCHLFGFSETAIRFPSLLFSAASVPLIYLLGKQVFGEQIKSERAGITAAVLLSVSPYAINYAHEAKKLRHVVVHESLDLLFVIPIPIRR